MNILDCLLPQFCVVCDVEGVVMCDGCVGRIDRSGVFLCPVCDEVSGFGSRHVGCESALDGVVSVTRYAQVEVQQLVRLLKYQYIESVASLKGEMMVRLVERKNIFDDIVFVPVPLSRRRFAQRGFNQAKLLADVVGGWFGFGGLRLFKTCKKYISSG